nr:ABC transporter permease subunit [uncultured Bacillus sp.]
MRNFLILFQKELKESLRSGKCIWLPIAFIILGISQPLSTYYMPQILESAGNLPDGAVIQLPTPSGEELLASTLSQFGTVGTLLIVIAFMGAISNERQNGTLTLVMVRPVRPIQYISSKFFSQILLTLVSFLLSYGMTWYYTNLLFHPVRWERVLVSFIIYSLWIVFTLSVTILMGTLLRAASGIAGVSILLLGGLSVLSGLLTKYTTWSPSNIRAQAEEILIQGKLSDNGVLVICTTFILSTLFVLLAARNFRRFEQF